MSTASPTLVRWIDSTSWELPFFGLPSHIPWPAEIDPAEANREPFEVEHLLRAIELLGSEAAEPWKSFLAAADYFSDLIEAMQESETAAAMRALEQIDRILPGTSFALYHRAFIARREGHNEEALELYRQAAEKTPNISAIWNNLGTLYAMKGERDEAVAAYRKALEVQPNDANALEGLASLRELVKLKSADPRQPNAVRYVDLPTFRQMALQQIESMSNSEQLFNYGEQLLRDGTALPAAVRALERCSELRPGVPKTMHALAAAYRVNGQLDLAKETMQRYTQLFPQDPNGHLHLAQISAASEDASSEEAALAAALELDPNNQAALGAKFRLGPGEHDPAKEDELAAFAAARNSWMAYLLAATLARERGDHPASLRQVERAYAIQPENEEVLLHYASSLAEMKELAKLAQIIRPAVEGGHYTKRLDWHYAHVLRQLNLTRDALEVLERSVRTGSVTDEYRQMVATTTDAWKGFLTGCGYRIEVTPPNYLQRPILISLDDGEDGGVLIANGTQLPAEAKFTWKANGERTAVHLQQGESESVREPQKLGAFRIRANDAAPTVECHIVVRPDGALHFRATQGGQKREVQWAQRVS